MRIQTENFKTELLHTGEAGCTVLLPDICRKTILWLHGYRERAADILAASNMTELAEKYETAIILPDVPDTYYLDQPWNHCETEKFLMRELFFNIIHRFRLPDKREEVCIAGISMGGFGSLLVGSHYPEVFGKIVSISGAFIIEDLLIGNPEITGDPWKTAAHFQNIFGDIPSLSQSAARNPRLAAIQAAERKQLPPVYMVCGSRDLLLERNRTMYRSLLQVGADIVWEEAEGGHDWGFFNSVLSRAFA